MGRGGCGYGRAGQMNSDRPHSRAQVCKCLLFISLLAAISIALCHAILRPGTSNQPKELQGETASQASHGSLSEGLTVERLRPAPSLYGVSGAYWEADLKRWGSSAATDTSGPAFSKPNPSGLLSPWWGAWPWRRSCADLARDEDEPYDLAYQPRGDDSNGGASSIPRAAAAVEKDEFHTLYGNSVSASDGVQAVSAQQPKPELQSLGLGITASDLSGRGFPGDLPGGVPRALWRWDRGTISRELFDSVPRWLRGR